MKTVTAHDSTSFSAGLEVGTRLAACVARLGALQLIEDSRWWNRRRHRLMARALVACADEMECNADQNRRSDEKEAKAQAISRPALVRI